MTLFEQAQLLDPEHNFAFMPRNNSTFCNCWTSVFCAARGIRLPPVSANEQFKWLSMHGEPDGWRVIGPAEAVTRANTHQLVIAIATALPHGHVAPLVESPDDDPMSAYVSAAGAHNYTRTRLERSFGPLQPVFFLNERAIH